MQKRILDFLNLESELIGQISYNLSENGTLIYSLDSSANLNKVSPTLNKDIILTRFLTINSSIRMSSKTMVFMASSILCIVSANNG